MTPGDQVDRLTVIAHWYATEGDGVPWVVIQAEGQDGHGMHHAIAECGTRASAEMIARALNAQGAVGAVRELADAAKSWLEPEGSRGYAHPAMIKARQVLDRFGKQ